MSEKDQAEVAKLKAEAWAIATGAYYATEETAAEGLSGDPVSGELPAPPEPPEMEMDLDPGAVDPGSGSESGGGEAGTGTGGM